MVFTNHAQAYVSQSHTHLSYCTKQPVEENWGTSSTIHKFIRKSRVGGLKMTSKASSSPTYRRRKLFLKSFIFVLLVKIEKWGFIL